MSAQYELRNFVASRKYIARRRRGCPSWWGGGDEKQSERCALLDGEPNGTKQGPTGNEGGGCACHFALGEGSIWKQPMRGDDPDYIVHISELKVHLKPRAEEGRETVTRRRKDDDNNNNNKTCWRSTGRLTTIFLSRILELVVFLGDVERSAVEYEAGGPDNLPSPPAHQRLPKPLRTGRPRRAKPGHEGQTA